MKKCGKVFVWFTLLLAVSGGLTCLFAEDWRTWPVLPQDLKIEPPSGGVPEKVAALSGAWKGDWGDAASVTCTIVIERITPQEVTAVFSMGEFVRDPDPQGWRRVKGTIQGEKIVLAWDAGNPPGSRRDRVTLTLKKKDEAFGEYERGALFIRGYFDRKE